MIFYDKDKQKRLLSSWIFLDTGILSDFSENEICNHALLELFPTQFFIVDPLVRLEFLRNTFELSYILKKESLLSNEPFLDCPNDQHIFQQVLHNALVISRIITQQFKKRRYSPSVVDLTLMGRAMLYPNSCIVTTDLGDYPSEFFIKKNIITIESDGADKLIHWQITQFDPTLFEQCYTRLPLST